MASGHQRLAGRRIDGPDAAPSDRTYAELIEQAVRISAGRGEIMVGVGDTSLAPAASGSSW